MNKSIIPGVEQILTAVRARFNLLLAAHTQALRLFNGYTEGMPGFTIDLYATTLVISMAKPPDIPLGELQACLLQELPWLQSIMVKDRAARDPESRRGKMLFGERLADRINENGCWYALDLTMNQDTSFYPDTRYLRKWLLEHAAGWQVVNTFAYTGSLGVAALAGGAENVVQVDHNKKFLSLAHRSCVLNKLETARMKLLTMDFFNAVAQLKRSGRLFNCVIVDPPFFSTTARGKVNLVEEGIRVINKLRPLVMDGGYLISINNALFLSGADYMASINALGVQGYIRIEEQVEVPVDFTGYPHTIVSHPPVDPAPFNHPTKIVILKVHRKS